MPTRRFWSRQLQNRMLTNHDEGKIFASESTGTIREHNIYKISLSRMPLNFIKLLMSKNHEKRFPCDDPTLDLSSRSSRSILIIFACFVIDNDTINANKI